MHKWLSHVGASFRFRLLSLVLLSTIPLVGLVLYEASEYRQQASIHIERNTRRYARLISLEERQLLGAVRDLLVVLAHTPQVRADTPAACGAFLARLLEQYKQYENIGLVQVGGKPGCSAFPIHGPSDLADPSLIRRALDAQLFDR